jgi:hypothetical protein
MVKPVAIFRIEGLSDGIDTGMRDELGDGAVIPQPNAKVPMGYDDYAMAKSRAIAAKRAEILQPLLNPKPVKPFKRRV